MQSELFTDTAWAHKLSPVLTKYAGRPHPLEYKNRYQLLVMVVLSAQDSDRHINEIAPAFFEAYPTLTHLSHAEKDDLRKYLGSVFNFEKKSAWIRETARTIGDDEKIPTLLEELVALPGIGRKSANVIIRESQGEAQGIIVDLHVLRVAPRIGIASGSSAEKIEKQLMQKLPHAVWNDAGMALSFLGREICRPAHPKCGECPINKICAFNNR